MCTPILKRLWFYWFDFNNCQKKLDTFCSDFFLINHVAWYTSILTNYLNVRNWSVLKIHRKKNQANQETLISCLATNFCTYFGLIFSVYQISNYFQLKEWQLCQSVVWRHQFNKKSNKIETKC